MIRNPKLLNTLALGALLAAIPMSGAHATKTVTSPYVHEGETAIEWKGGYNINEDDGNDDSVQMKASVAHGFTSFWEVEVGVEGEDVEDEDAEFSAVFIENKFQLAPKGAYFVDPGVRIDYDHSLTGGPDEVEVKLMLAKTLGDFGNFANFSVSREIGEDSEDDFGYGFAYGLVYNYTDTFQFGAEWYSDFGDFAGDFDEQGHQFGPVAYGEITEGLGFETGVLFGVSDSSPDALVKAVIEYEF